MKLTRMTKSGSVLAGLVLAMLTIPLAAQPVHESHPGRGFAAAYDAAREVTINGTVQEVVTKHALGSPAGLHLLVAGPQGMVDAHVGPFLTKDTRDALHAGVPVQIVGAMEKLHGKQFLLARQLTFGGRMVTIRSQRGMLLRGSPRAPSSRSRTAKSPTNGGAR